LTYIFRYPSTRPSPSYFIGLYKNKTRERVSLEVPQVGLSVEDQQFRSGIRTFVLSNIDELSRQFGGTIGLSIADYRNRTKDEFLGDLVEKLFQKSFYKNQNHILELFANNSQPDVDISQEAIKAYLLSYREAYQVLLQFRQYAKVTTNAKDTFNK
jgi:hypothetical protein